jgi:hypothetical integral membrane protein (TIGR02206 family)
VSPPRFVAFGPSHLAALGVIALVTVALVALVRSHPKASLPLRLLLACGQVVLVAFEMTIGVREGWLDWKSALPLELCDAAMVLAVVSLFVPRRATAELVYYWAGTGTLLAMLTPELAWDFPRWEFFVFFGLHGLVVASAILLIFGLGLHPRPGAPLRVLLITAAYAAFVGLVNLTLGTNFMYLGEKPTVATPLDWMGPWPVYLAVGALVAFVLFYLLSLPFLREWRAARRHA